MKITLTNNILVIAPDADHELLKPPGSIFLTAGLGFRFSRDSSSFELEEAEGNLNGTLRELISYLNESGIAFDADRNVSGRLDALQAEHKGIATARARQADGNAKLPSQFIRTLKPYQLTAVQKALHASNWANFSVPGSGKTTVAYAVFATLVSEGVIDSLLVIGPRSAFLPWQEEATACFSPSPGFVRISGSKYERSDLIENFKSGSVGIATYQTIANDLEAFAGLLKRQRFLVVIDESHNMKRFEGGVRSNALIRLASFATSRAILSGTPAPNSLEDLWTQFTFLWPSKELLGERAAFKRIAERPTASKQISSLIEPFTSRVRKLDLGLPSPTIERVRYKLKPYQSMIYKALAVKFLRELNLAPKEELALRNWRRARMIRLLQAASNPALLGRYDREFEIPPLIPDGDSLESLIRGYAKFEVPAKIEAAISEISKLLLASKKVVIWTTFVQNIEMLRSLLQTSPVFTIHGGIPSEDNESLEFSREQQLTSFKTATGGAVLLANPAACAESISLHKSCQDAIYLDRSFNCGHYMQSLDRIHRIGISPDVKVTYKILMASGTIDDAVDTRLEEKKKAMLALLDGEEIAVGELLDRASEGEDVEDFAAVIQGLRSFYGAPNS